MNPLNRRDLFKNSLPGGAALAGLSTHNAAFGTETASPVVETRDGKVRGVSAGGVSMFKSIPYGGAVDGAGRFMPPSKPAKWTGILDATKPGPRCVQGHAGQPMGFLMSGSGVVGGYMSGGKQWPDVLAQTEESENCLILNVVTPNLKGKRPVIVYIHGGGYANLSGLQTLLAEAHTRENNVVLVGINHRLNVFGYTYLGGLSEKYAMGNPGQLDLVLALEWIRDNIAHFGGDPLSVTLWGDSGGGGKISALMAMPAAKGLFHKAIVSSGSSLRAGDVERSTANAKALLAKFELTERQVDELQKIPADKLHAAGGGGGGPVVDGHSIPHETWDPKAPEFSVSVPMIIGHCTHETTIMQAGVHDELLSLDWAALPARLAGGRRGNGNSMSQADVASLLALYRRDHPQDTPSLLYFRILADRGATRNAVTQAELKMEQGKANVYIYQFDWATPLYGGKLGAFHTAEMPLAMRIVLYPEADELSKQMSATYAAFARTGNPNHRGLPEWPAYTIAKRAVMFWDVPKCCVVNDPDSEERVFLKKFSMGGLL
jgi:para-nitrobenzyl esterase